MKANQTEATPAIALVRGVVGEQFGLWFDKGIAPLFIYADGHGRSCQAIEFEVLRTMETYDPTKQIVVEKSEITKAEPHFTSSDMTRKRYEITALVDYSIEEIAQPAVPAEPEMKGDEYRLLCGCLYSPTYGAIIRMMLFCPIPSHSLLIPRAKQLTPPKLDFKHPKDCVFCAELNKAFSWSQGSMGGNSPVTFVFNSNFGYGTDTKPAEEPTFKAEEDHPLFLVQVKGENKLALAFKRNRKQDGWFVLLGDDVHYVNDNKIETAEPVWAFTSEMMSKPVYNPKTHKVVPIDASVITAKYDSSAILEELAVILDKGNMPDTANRVRRLKNSVPTLAIEQVIHTEGYTLRYKITDDKVLHVLSFEATEKIVEPPLGSLVNIDGDIWYRWYQGGDKSTRRWKRVGDNQSACWLDIADSYTVLRWGTDGE